MHNSRCDDSHEVKVAWISDDIFRDILLVTIEYETKLKIDTRMRAMQGLSLTANSSRLSRIFCERLREGLSDPHDTTTAGII